MGIPFTRGMGFLFTMTLGIQLTVSIAHITVLLVALTAHRLGYEDKIRYVKSFLPNLML